MATRNPDILASLGMTSEEIDALAADCERELSDFYGADYLSWLTGSGVLDASDADASRIIAEHYRQRKTELATASKATSLVPL